jgi:hypothetical protein
MDKGENMKSVIVKFVIEREYELDEITLKEAKEMATQDFWDDARHGNLEPVITVKVKI